MRLVLMGPPCVGKTSFKSLLFNWSAPKRHDSTALATRPIRAVERVAERNEGKIWDRVTGPDLLKMLSDAIRALEQQSDDSIFLESEATCTNLSSQLTSNVTINLSKDVEAIEESYSSPIDTAADDRTCSSSTSMLLATTSLSLDVDAKPSEKTTAISFVSQAMFNTSTFPSEITASIPIPTTLSSSEETIADTSNTTSSKLNTAFLPSEITASPIVPITHPQQSMLSTDPDSYSKQMVNILAEREVSEDLHKATWINILDSGGQPQFADVSRAFIHGNTINIICTNLRENLSDKPKFYYSLNGKLLNQPSELQMTNLQLIEHFVHSVAASKSMAVVGSNQSLTLRPFFMIVGTRYDKIRFLPFSESLHQKNAQILSSLSKFRDCLIFYNKSSEEVIFPVDNLCRLNREKISSSIRERIMSFQKDVGVSLPIPIRWYMFELRVKEEASENEHGMISLESCCTIGINFSMNEDDVIKSITYLHSMALFLYFRAILPNVIFTNPQYLLDMLSKLIRVSFVDLLNDILPEGQSLLPQMQREFRSNGVFEEPFLDKLCLPFVSSLFTKTHFLDLLQYLCIAAPFIARDSLKHYFIPVVLPPRQLTDNAKSVFMKVCDPMILIFQSNVVPQVSFLFH